MRRTVLKAMLAAPCAWAQPAGFPNRSLRMIVPFAAGGAADVVARLMAQGMSEALGQQVVVENRGGSGGVLGSEAALAAPARPPAAMPNGLSPPGAIWRGSWPC